MTDISPKRAVVLWKDGANTLEIAIAMGCDEAMIYNNLPQWRRLSKQWEPTATRNSIRVPAEKADDYRFLRERKGLSAAEVAQILKLV